ncbi:MAG: hypothetical protein JRJ39_16865 [Deltaproteobacteria bacterium]|nr:hypothetical protein [Deltaproteobacteria bacterium]
MGCDVAGRLFVGNQSWWSSENTSFTLMEVKHEAQLAERCGHCSLVAANLLEPIRPCFPVLYQGA